MTFAGLRVLALESRRSVEMAQLIRKQGGDAFVAPSMRERPLENNTEAYAFAERLFAGGFDMMILLTGVGTRQLRRVLAARFPDEQLAQALRKLTVVARGPKPVAALREMDVVPAIVAPEPNTWREVLAVTEGRPEHRIAVLEYGRSNAELLSALRARGAQVTPVRIYQWDLPEDVEPLREAVTRLAAGEFDVVLFTTAIQIHHLIRVARELGCDDAVESVLPHMVVASIGPSTSEALEEFGITPDLEPSHPKLGYLVLETAARAHEILQLRRTSGEGTA